jgi:hypothetical protein
MMYFTTAPEPDAPPSTAHETPTLRWEERAALIANLLASN